MIPITMAVFLACLPQTVLQVQQGEMHEQGIHYSIDVKYPEIEKADQFNAAVRQAVGSLTESFRKGGMPEISAADGPTDGYLDGSYNAAILKNGIISVLLDYSEYTPGAVHPWGVMASINYDSRTCRVLALSDLFRPGVNYRSRISQLAIATLDQNEFADHHAIRHGAGPLESNFKVFTLTDTALVLHFPMYQVAAGAAGAQSVVIPLDKLAPLLRKR
jgi:hypothetical protein